jgi:hypothetical protein
MDLIFMKRSGKNDELTIVRSGIASEIVACPKQGLIPHDMVHYAVESVLTHRGFLSLVEEGRKADFTTAGADSEEAVERLVETFQAEMWGGRVSVMDLLSTYEHACNARGHGAAAVSADDVEAVRSRIDELSLQWSALATNEALTVRF